MATSPSLATTLKGTNIDLDFSKIRQRLKDFLSSQDQFVDYNFEASGISILLDVLAYNTQMNAMTAHLALNELFLDSAQARPNVVSLAKQLGYLTRSVSSAIAAVNVTVVPPYSYRNDTLTLQSNSVFKGGGLLWYAMDSHTVSKNAKGNFYFTNVNLREGRQKVVRYYYDARNPYPKFEIPDRDVDVTSIKVRVKETEKSEYFTTYKPFTYFSSIDSNTAVYFIEENALGLYEIYFTGKEIGGISPSVGNVIEIDYVYSNGAAANGVSVFKTDVVFSRAGETLYITTAASATGGRDKESVEAVRQNAPYYFEAQNRCVSFNDYASVIKKEIPQAQSVNVWGGETNFPAEFGRVYISIKPTDGLTISSALKQYIINSVLKPKAVATISPRIVDAEYTYIGLDIEVKYDQNKTTNSSQHVSNIVKNACMNFSETYLNSFEGPFRYSKFLAMIDNAEISIENSMARIYLIKRIYLRANQENEFVLTIPSEFYDFDENDKFIQSSLMTINGLRYYVTDRKDSNNNRKRQLILIYTSSAGEQVIENVDVGYIDLDLQTIFIYGFRPDVDTVLTVYINPKSNDVIPSKNQIIAIDENFINVTVTPDYLEANVYPGVVRSKTTSRNLTFFER